MEFVHTRSDYAELAKVVHSVSASLTTVFLSTRLWARKTKHKGLWWDDYICKLLFLVKPLTYMMI